MMRSVLLFKNSFVLFSCFLHFRSCAMQIKEPRNFSISKFLSQNSSYNSTNNLMHRITKRSSLCNNPDINRIVEFYNENICQSTLTLYIKNDCKKLSRARHNLEIDKWPQAYGNCLHCIGVDTYTSRLHVSYPASTIVRVFQNEMKIWVKIKVTVGYYCGRALFIGSF